MAKRQLMNFFASIFVAASVKKVVKVALKFQPGKVHGMLKKLLITGS